MLESFLILTIPISIFIKKSTFNKISNFLLQETVCSSKEINNTLQTKLLKFKKFHYFIPLENLLVVTLYISSYFLQKKEILSELTPQKEVKNIEINDIKTTTSNSQNITGNMVKIQKEKEALNKVKQDLLEQKEFVLKRHK